MKATLTELHRETRKIVRRVIQGKSVGITEHGAPIARLTPDCERVVLSAEELRSLEVTDQAILNAIDESRQ